eukprot:2637988-Rhodomonas_salina.1
MSCVVTAGSGGGDAAGMELVSDLALAHYLLSCPKTKVSPPSLPPSSLSLPPSLPPTPPAATPTACSRRTQT